MCIFWLFDVDGGVSFFIVTPVEWPARSIRKFLFSGFRFARYIHALGELLHHMEQVYRQRGSRELVTDSNYERRRHIAHNLMDILGAALELLQERNCLQDLEKKQVDKERMIHSLHQNPYIKVPLHRQRLDYAHHL